MPRQEKPQAGCSANSGGRSESAIRLRPQARVRHLRHRCRLAHVGDAGSRGAGAAQTCRRRRGEVRGHMACSELRSRRACDQAGDAAEIDDVAVPGHRGARVATRMVLPNRWVVVKWAISIAHRCGWTGECPIAHHLSDQGHGGNGLTQPARGFARAPLSLPARAVYSAASRRAYEAAQSSYRRRSNPR